MAQLGLFLHGSSYMALLTMSVLTVALLTMALLTMAGGGTRALGRREWYGAARKVKLNKGLQTAEQPRVHCVCSSARGRCSPGAAMLWTTKVCGNALRYVACVVSLRPRLRLETFDESQSERKRKNAQPK